VAEAGITDSGAGNSCGTACVIAEGVGLTVEAMPMLSAHQQEMTL